MPHGQRARAWGNDLPQMVGHTDGYVPHIPSLKRGRCRSLIPLYHVNSLLIDIMPGGHTVGIRQSYNTDETVIQY